MDEADKQEFVANGMPNAMAGVLAHGSPGGAASKRPTKSFRGRAGHGDSPGKSPSRNRTPRNGTPKAWATSLEEGLVATTSSFYETPPSPTVRQSFK